MGRLDAPLGKMANKVVTALGGTATYSRSVGGSFNPATGDVEGASTSTSSVGVAPGPAARRVFDEALIQAGDRTGIVARTDLGFTPNPGTDTLSWLGDTWEIVGYEAYTTGDQDAAWALLLRR